MTTTRLLHRFLVDIILTGRMDRAHRGIAPTLRISRLVRRCSTLHGKIIALIFEKPSPHRVTLDVRHPEMALRGFPRPHAGVRISRRAGVIADVARNLERWVQGIRRRVYITCLGGNGGRNRIPWHALSDSFICRRLTIFLHWKKNSAPCGFKLHNVGDGKSLPFFDLLLRGWACHLRLTQGMPVFAAFS